MNIIQQETRAETNKAKGHKADKRKKNQQREQTNKHGHTKEKTETIPKEPEKQKLLPPTFI